MNFEGFKKIASDKKTTTLKHPKGHSIKVVHGALSKEAQEAIAGVPHYADGGEVVKDFPADDEMINVASWKKAKEEEAQPLVEAAQHQQMSYQAPSIFPSSTAPVQMEQPGLEQAAMPVESATAQQMQRSPAASERMLSSAGEMKSGLLKEAELQGQVAKEQSGVYNKYLEDLQKINQRSQDSYKDWKAEHQKLQADVMSGHIEPGRFMANKSTGQKVMTAIGLMLSGIGAGMSGQENMAMKFLNKQIEDDILAQKEEMNTKQNLVRAHMDQFKNEQDAMAMTKADMLGLAKAQLEQKALQFQDPILKARAQQKAAEIQMAIDKEIAPLQQKEQVKQLMNQGQLLPEEAVNFLVPQQDRAKAREEISMVNSYNASEKKIKDLYKQAEAIGVSGHIPYANKAKLEVLQAEVMGTLMGQLRPATGNMSDDEREAILRPYIFTALDTKEQVRNKMIGALETARSAITKGTPTLKGYGIDLDRFPSTSTNPLMRLSPQQRQWADYAIKNPQDPNSAIMLKKLGLD